MRKPRLVFSGVGRSRQLAGSLALLILAATAAVAQTPTMVADINPVLVGPPGTSITPLASTGDLVFLRVCTEAYGCEVWRSDGTRAGTVLVRDIFPGQASGLGGAPQFVWDPVGGVGYFLADDDQHLRGLWRTDGTSKGTSFVATPYPSYSQFDHGCCRDLAAANGRAYFRMDGDDAGVELWTGDGTIAGTRMVADLVPGAESSWPQELTTVGGALFFVAIPSWAGGTLWTVGPDGGAARLVLGPVGYSWAWPAELVAWKGELYFLAPRPAAQFFGLSLWKSDGTAQGTLPAVATIPNPSGALTPAGDLLFFLGGTQLWRSDGTASGTWGLTLPVRPEACPVSVNGTYLFAGADDHGNELWRTNGTVVGTQRVKDIVFGPGSSGPAQLTVSGNRLFFTAQGTDTGREPWVSDGTANGTQLVTDLRNGPMGSEPSGLVAIDGGVLLVADNGRSGTELWRIDGADGGMRLVRDFSHPFAGSLPTQLTPVGTWMYFTADDGAHGRELWRAGIGAAGADLVADLAPGDAGSDPRDLTSVAGTLFFTADDGGGRRLYGHVGIGGAEAVQGSPASIEALSASGTVLYLAGSTPSTGSELWRVDSSKPWRATLVKDIVPGQSGSAPSELVSIDGVLFFVATGVQGWALWRSDGTESGTVEVRRFTSGRPPPSKLTSVAGRLFFVADEPPVGEELWVSDGTFAGTTRVVDGVAGLVPYSPSDLTPVGDTLFFVATGGAGGRALWKTNGRSDGTGIVLDGSPSGASAPSELVGAGRGQLFFVIDDGVHGAEVWVSDGTPGGTRLVKDIAPAERSSSPRSLTAVEQVVYFAADDGVHGQELWQTDVFAVHTVLVSDLSPGAAGAAPAQITKAGPYLYFAADDGDIGVELWFLNTATAVVPSEASVPPRGRVGFTGAGGSRAGYRWFMVESRSGGWIGEVSGEYLAGPTGGVTDVIEVVDSARNRARASVSVTSGVAVSPATADLAPGEHTRFVAAGGSGVGYAWTVSGTESGASIDAESGEYVAGDRSGTDTVEVHDSLGNRASALARVRPGSHGPRAVCGCSGAHEGAVVWTVFLLLLAGMRHRRKSAGVR